jgi:hypothetical protein
VFPTYRQDAGWKTCRGGRDCTCAEHVCTCEHTLGDGHRGKSGRCYAPGCACLSYYPKNEEWADQLRAAGIPMDDYL